jgi:hypothetical protein
LKANTCQTHLDVTQPTSTCYYDIMSQNGKYVYILIRDSNILVRIPLEAEKTGDLEEAELFDVRTGVQVREIHPALQASELGRGYRLNEECATAIIQLGAPAWAGPSVDLSKVVSILEVKQRRLDSVVAESVLDQLRVIVDILKSFLDVTEKANAEEKLWLSQQVLSLVGKFSGREMAELEEMVEWFRTRPRR